MKEYVSVLGRGEVRGLHNCWFGQRHLPDGKVAVVNVGKRRSRDDWNFILSFFGDVDWICSGKGFGRELSLKACGFGLMLDVTALNVQAI